MPSRLLICGGRDFTNYEAMAAAITALDWRPTIIIQGGARGADALAKQWAIQNGVHYAEVPAQWTRLGSSAGRFRNQAMLLLNPEFCIAMPGGPGTADMVRRCTTAGIGVWEPYPNNKKAGET